MADDVRKPRSITINGPDPGDGSRPLVRLEPATSDVALPDVVRWEILDEATARHAEGSEVRVDPYGSVWVIPAEIMTERTRGPIDDPALQALLHALDDGVPEGHWVTGIAYGPIDD